MKRISFPLSNLSVLLIIVAVLIQCASVHKSYYSELIPRYAGSAQFSLTDSSFIEELSGIMITFGDTLAIDTITTLWYEISTHEPAPDSTVSKPSIETISVMADLLKNRGYTVATIQPDFYESLYALAKLPQLMWIAVIHYQEDKPAFITQKDVTLSHSSVLSSVAPSMQLHLIRNIIKSDNTYKIITQDGLILPGLATDQCNAQIQSGDKNSSAKYLQVVDCFFVSLLPLTEIQEHIDEWYTTTPYKYVKPEIQELE